MKSELRTFFSGKILCFCVFMWSTMKLLAFATPFGQYEIVKVLSYAFERVFLRAICLLCIFLEKRPRSEVLKSFIILALAEITNHFATTNIFIPLMYILAIGNNIDENRIIKTLLKSNLLVVGIAFSSSLLHITPLISGVNSNYLFGFLTSNTGPIILFQIAAASFFLHKKISYNLLAAGTSFFISYFFCRSRTASMLSLALLIIEIFWWITVNQRSKLLKKMIWKIIYCISILSSLVLFLTIAISTDWVDAYKYNTLFSGRIAALKLYYKYYGMTLWGQRILAGDAMHYNGLFTLDNSYLHMFIAYGIVLTSFYAYYMFRLIFKCIKNAEIKKLIIIILYLLYGFTEIVQIRFLYNFSLIFLVEVVFPRINGSRIQKES